MVKGQFTLKDEAAVPGALKGRRLGVGAELASFALKSVELILSIGTGFEKAGEVLSPQGCKGWAGNISRIAGDLLQRPEQIGIAFAESLI